MDQIFVIYSEDVSELYHVNGIQCKLENCKVKFTFSEKATKIDEIFAVNLTLTYT